MCEKKRFHGTHERGRCAVSAAAMAGWCGAAVGAARCKEEEEEERQCWQWFEAESLRLLCA